MQPDPVVVVDHPDTAGDVHDDTQGQVPWNGIVIANPLEELWDAAPPPAHHHLEEDDLQDPTALEDRDANNENIPPSPVTHGGNLQPQTGAALATISVGEASPEQKDMPIDTRHFPALQLREVLFEIVLHCDNASCASCAQVCKHWSSVALAVLYRRSPELYDLVSLLAPVTETSFSRELVPANWTRFNIYAPLVKCLSHDTTGSLSGRHLSETVFQELALSRPNIHILPNLRSLTWTASRPRFLRASLLFLQESVTKFSLKITRSDGAKSFETYLSMLAERVPNLIFLEIDTPRAVGEYQEQFCQLLSRLNSLRALILPHFFVTTQVLATVSNMPCLETVQLRKGEHVGESKDLNGLQLPSGPDMFPSIGRLSLDVQLSDMMTFLQSKHPQPWVSLKYIHISSLALESPQTLHSFLTLLPSTVPRLSGLMLALLSVSVANPSFNTHITLATLSPLFAIPRLAYFGITYNYPLRITNSDCQVLAKGLSKLKSLWLCESSYDTHDREATGLDLGCLKYFAEECEELEELGLFLDAEGCVNGGRMDADADADVDDQEDGDSGTTMTAATMTALPTTPTTPTVADELLPDNENDTMVQTVAGATPLPAITTPFKTLRVLSVGQSFLPATHIIPTALYLSQLLPSGCTFQTGCTDKAHSFSPTYHEASPNPDSDDAFQVRLNQWAEVKKLVPTLQSVRLREQEKRKEVEAEREGLRDEIERLRKEVAMLRSGNVTPS